MSNISLEAARFCNLENYFYAIADFDGDGLDDLILNEYISPNFVFLSNVDGTFVEPNRYDPVFIPITENDSNSGNFAGDGGLLIVSTYKRQFYLNFQIYMFEYRSLD